MAEPNALFLPDPISRLLCYGSLRAILYDERLDIEGRDWRFFDRFHERGVIRLMPPYRVNLATVRRLRWMHRVSDAEIRRWWPEAKALWLYPIDDVFPLEKPRRVRVQPNGSMLTSLP